MKPEDTNLNKKINERLHEAIRAVIRQQIEERNPPEVVEALERLQDDGFSEDEALQLIGQVISLEMSEIIMKDETIDMIRYKEALENLPTPFAAQKKSE